LDRINKIDRMGAARKKHTERFGAPVKTGRK